MNVQAPEPLRLVSLRRDVDPPPQVLQTDGRRYHAAPASHVVGGSAEQQGPFAPRALPRLLATPGPSATLSPSADFPGAPVIRPTSSTDFAVRRGGLLQLLDASWSPCCRSQSRRSTPPRQPDCGSPCCLRGVLVRSASGADLSGPTRVHLRYGPVTRSPSSRWLRRWASESRSPSTLPSKLR